MNKTERVIAYDLMVGSEKLDAGTKVADLVGRDWLTPAWLRDAEACGHVKKVIVEPEPAAPVEPALHEDPLAHTLRLVSDDPDGGLESEVDGEGSGDQGMGPGDDSKEPVQVGGDVQSDARNDVQNDEGDVAGEIESGDVAGSAETAEIELPAVQSSRKSRRNK